MSRKSIAVLACLLAVALGCNSSRITGPVGPTDKERAQIPKEEPAYTAELPIDSRIRFRLHETLTHTGRPLELQCETEHIYPTGGYVIVTSTVAHERLVSVAFLSVRAPVLGTTFPVPASARIPLGMPADGGYPLHLRVNGDLVPARIVVDRDSIRVIRGGGRWTVFARPTLHRVPPGTLWGLIGWGPGDESAGAQAFLDALVGAGARTALLAPGDYEYFVIGRDGTIETPRSHGYYHAKAFLFRYGGDRSQLAGIVRSYAGPLHISMFDDEGDRWLSWLLGPE